MQQATAPLWMPFLTIHMQAPTLPPIIYSIPCHQIYSIPCCQIYSIPCRQLYTPYPAVKYIRHTLPLNVYSIPCHQIYSIPCRQMYTPYPAVKCIYSIHCSTVKYIRHTLPSIVYSIHCSTVKYILHTLPSNVYSIPSLHCSKAQTHRYKNSCLPLFPPIAFNLP